MEQFRAVGQWHDTDRVLPEPGDLCIGWRKQTKDYVFFAEKMGTAQATDFDKWFLLCEAPKAIEES